MSAMHIVAQASVALLVVTAIVAVRWIVWYELWGY